MKVNLTPEETLILNRLANSNQVSFKVISDETGSTFSFRIGLPIDGVLTFLSFYYRKGEIDFPCGVGKDGYPMEPKDGIFAQVGFYPDIFIMQINAALPDFFTSYLELRRLEINKQPQEKKIEFLMYGVLDKTLGLMIA